MTTLADVRLRLRRMLEDTDLTAPVWSDAELNDWLATATRDYSLRRPRSVTTTLAAVAGQTRYPLPDDTLQVVTVECPAGTPLPRRAARQLPTPGAAQSWAWLDGVLVLGEPPAAPLVVTYRATYPWPTVDSDAVTLPPEGIDLVVLGATVLALSRREIAASKRRGGSNGVNLALGVALQMHDAAWLRLIRSRPLS